MKIRIYNDLDTILNETDISAYQLQKEGIRLATVLDMRKNKMKSIRFETAENILDTINRLSSRSYTINDLIKSEFITDDQTNIDEYIED